MVAYTLVINHAVPQKYHALLLICNLIPSLPFSSLPLPSSRPCVALNRLIGRHYCLCQNAQVELIVH
jgi:hypothetical protein